MSSMENGRFFDQFTDLPPRTRRSMAASASGEAAELRAISYASGAMKPAKARGSIQGARRAIGNRESAGSHPARSANKAGSAPVIQTLAANGREHPVRVRRAASFEKWAATSSSSTIGA